MNVSIVNWIRNPAVLPPHGVLDGVAVPAISPALRPEASDVSSAETLSENAGRCFYGPIPAGKGFVLPRSHAEKFLEEEPSYREVIRPYLVGDDIATSPTQEPSRFIIDFGLRSFEEAMQYPKALDVVRLLVKPERDQTRRKAYRERWWRFAEPLVAMRSAVADLSRYIAGTATGKRILFCWCDPWWCPSNATNVFAFDDDGSMGVLCSSVHREWARVQSSTLRVDIRYTPKSAFGTFPWPADGLDGVADITRRLIDRRSEICVNQTIGLTKLYNQVDDGAWVDLRELHRELDEAVAVAYGWPKSVAHDPDETNRRLLKLNRAISEGEIPYKPFKRVEAHVKVGQSQKV